MYQKDAESCLKLVISSRDLASLVGLSERQLRRLVEDGVLRLAKDRQRRQMPGRFVLGDTVPKFIAYREKLLASDDPNEARFKAARAAREEADAEMARIELGYRRREFLRADKIEADIIRMLMACRSRLLAIPSAVARSLIGKTDFKEIYLILETAIHTALLEISKLGEAGRERERNL